MAAVRLSPERFTVVATRARRASALAVSLLAARTAHAVDLPKLGSDPVRLEVVETSIAAQHFSARDGEKPTDQGYGAWLNRLNVALRWKKWTLGTRLDSSFYWWRPDEAISNFPASQQENVRRDGATRYRNSLYPAKLWATYQSPNLEVTVGDAYVQFGRGLVLSMRKIDELGVDNTVRGAKVAWQSDPFAMTLVAGVANPSRVDEATGRALFLPKSIPGDSTAAQPVIGSDRIVGAQIQAGRGTPLVLSTHAVRLTRCAPYHYDAAGRVADGAFDAPFGSCDPNDTKAWLSVPAGGGPAINASEIDTAGQSLEIPSLWHHGSLYVEAAVQHRYHDGDVADVHPNGNAVSGSLSTDFGPITNTLEIKSYRNFYASAGAVDISRTAAFNNILYSSPPTAELITQDAMFGFFNACVDGGRLRTDVKTSDTFLFYGIGAYAHTKSEISGGSCDELGRSTTTVRAGADSVHNDVWDGAGGIEWRFDHDQSHLFASAGARDDSKSNGETYYKEFHTEYAFTKHIAGPYSVELQGRHRLRREENQNARNGAGTEQFWREGENYTALKIAPKWVISQGFEYLTLAGFPTYYLNGSVLYRFTEGSNFRFLVGQQRGGLKCVSGVCKVFPPFSGVRAEITIRF